MTLKTKDHCYICGNNVYASTLEVLVICDIKEHLCDECAFKIQSFVLKLKSDEKRYSKKTNSNIKIGGTCE